MLFEKHGLKKREREREKDEQNKRDEERESLKCESKEGSKIKVGMDHDGTFSLSLFVSPSCFFSAVFFTYFLNDKICASCIIMLCACFIFRYYYFDNLKILNKIPIMAILLNIKTTCYFDIFLEH